MVWVKIFCNLLKLRLKVSVVWPKLLLLPNCWNSSQSRFGQSFCWIVKLNPGFGWSLGKWMIIKLINSPLRPSPSSSTQPMTWSGQLACFSFSSVQGMCAPLSSSHTRHSRPAADPGKTVLPDGKIWSLPFLGLRQGGGRGAQSKEGKGSNFAA